MSTRIKKFLSLRQKLILAMIIYIVILVFGVPAIFYSFYYPKQSANLDLLIQGIEKLATTRLEVLLDPVNKEGIERVLPRIIVLKELKYVGVFDPQKKLLAELYENEKVIDFPKEINVEVKKDGRILGSYKMIFTEKYVIDEIYRGIKRLIIFLLGNAAISFFVLIYFLRFVITKQLEDINDFIKSFDSSTTTFPEVLKLNKTRFFRDEFDLVAEEIDELVTKVVHHNREEKNRYNVIESEVYKRTDALLQAKQKADKAAQEKIEFIGVISHEIRNPINSILGYSELLEREIKDPEKIELLKPIVESSNSLLNLVNDLLDVSKVEVGKLKIEMSPTKILEFIKSLERIYRPKAEAKALAFSFITDENFPKFMVIDSLRLTQVISNLIDNSLKFTNSGFIKVTFNHSPSKTQNKVNIKIAVEDSGLGIPKEEWPVLFEKFRQPKGQSYKKFKGSGLGLSICKKITQLLGGDIHIVEKDGAGTLFVIDLPEITLAQESDFKTEEFIEEYVFEKSKVLLVEDEKIIQDLVKWNLKAFPIELIIANNGKEGINMALIHSPDLILMDIMMPNMDGIEAIELIRVYENLKKVPIVVISAILGTEVDKKISHLVSGMLKKPVLQRELYKELAKYLPHKIKKISTKEKEGVQEEPIPDSIKKEFKEQFFSKLNDLYETMSILDGKKLAEEISLFAKSKNISSLLTWTQEFKTSIDKFDIKNIKDLITKIKNKTSI